MSAISSSRRPRLGIRFDLAKRLRRPLGRATAAPCELVNLSANFGLGDDAEGDTFESIGKSPVRILTTRHRVHAMTKVQSQELPGRQHAMQSAWSASGI